MIVEPAPRTNAWPRQAIVRLVHAAIRQAHDSGYRVMYLIAEEGNASARRVYEKNGFREHNRIVRYKVEL